MNKHIYIFICGVRGCVINVPRRTCGGADRAQSSIYMCVYMYKQIYTYIFICGVGGCVILVPQRTCGGADRTLVLYIYMCVYIYIYIYLSVVFEVA